MVALDRVLTEAEQAREIDRAVWHHGRSDEAQLKELIERHFEYTGSPRAKELLEDWAEARRHFVKVFPHEYKRALKELSEKHAEREAVVA